jgi:hypothetical protein
MIGRRALRLVMAGLMPAIHDILATMVPSAELDHSHEARKQSVDGRHKAGHDDQGSGELRA